ncbi:CsbD family protein [Aureimonas sp. ME7]|uniref:CsbD family protein n=1 Tax=Aureimonas sp. ME7 TaxID=2744252 RepID=UPI0015F9EB5F|nr:CsbD family protein [Aureimonas sp. ME7]
MGSTSDKASGLTNEAIGNIKQGVGKAVGNERLQAEGAAQELKGEAQQAVGDAKAAVKKGADDLSDAAHRKL